MAGFFATKCTLPPNPAQLIITLGLHFLKKFLVLLRLVKSKFCDLDIPKILYFLFFFNFDTIDFSDVIDKNLDLLSIKYNCR